MAKGMELLTTLGEQMWQATRAFLNEMPDDVTDEHIAAAAQRLGVTFEYAKEHLTTSVHDPIASWAELGEYDQAAWLHFVEDHAMPNLANMVRNIEIAQRQRRN